MTRALRVLVVDDSALNRNEVVLALSGIPDTEVVGLARDGVEALRLLPELHPDVITLDLQMPRIDGFSFLRIVPTVWRCPVIVLSGNTGDKEVFRALELGAVDFVPKPETSAERLRVLPKILQEKLQVVRALGPGALRRPTQSLRAVMPPSAPTPRVQTRDIPRTLIAVAASTGGPTAVTELLTGLDHRLSIGVVVAQHMPDKFTKTFAERLNRHLRLVVQEAARGNEIGAGTVLICPGRQCLEVTRRERGFVANVTAPLSTDRYVPSADRLLSTVAVAAGRNAVGVVLTGMGDDGLRGSRAIHEQGGVIVTESEETAVVYGMPRVVAEAGLARRSLAISKIAGYLNDLARG